MTVDPAWVPRRSPHLHTAVLDGETVLYDERNHSTLRLNSSATEVWEAIDGRSSVETIVADLAMRYRESPQALHDDVATLLERLVDDRAVLADP
jgi:hypothetical protein